MMPAERFPFLRSPAIRSLPLIARGTWHGRGLDPTTCSASSVRVLVLVGLMVGALALPLLLARALGSGPSAILHDIGLSPKPDVTWNGSPPQESFTLTDDDLDDTDALSSLVGLTAQDASPPPAPALINAIHAYAWTFRYLARPQLLTRL
jgi:hypothetical protein